MLEFLAETYAARTAPDTAASRAGEIAAATDQVSRPELRTTTTKAKERP